MGGGEGIILSAEADITVKGLNLVLICSSSIGANDSKLFHVSFEVSRGGGTQGEAQVVEARCEQELVDRQ